MFRPTGTYATEHPVGTGPFMFEEWTVGERLVMKRNPDYWGEVEGNIETLIFTPIANNADRLAALQAGDIQGYDLVEPQDFETISGDENLQLIERPAFNVAYIGFAQEKQTLDAEGNVTDVAPNTPVDDIEVRKAIAHAIDRQEVVDAFYAGQGEVAKEFMPPELWGYADDVTEYEYDPEKAKQILEDAGYELPVKLTFGFPTDVSRPYMPDPQANYEAFKADLEECCFTVETVSAPWSPDYLSAAQTGQYPAYLLGWTGDFGDPDNFVGTFFQSPDPQWGFNNKEIHDLLDQAERATEEAERATDQAERESLYQEANLKIMEFLPGIPYAHTKPALAFTANVTGYEPSPVTLESFARVTVEE